MAEVRPEVEVECEHCGREFVVTAPRHRKVTCPGCGARTLVPFRREPLWFAAVFGAALAAIAVPALTYRFVGPVPASVVAMIAIGALWWFGRRL